MYETPEDLAELQKVIDDSYSNAGKHLLDLHGKKYRMSAEQMSEKLTGMCLLTLATVSSDGTPTASPVDGMFYRGRFWCGSAPYSVRARHIAADPRVSAVHTQGESLGVIVHGRALIADKSAEKSLGLRDYAIEVYDKQTIDHFWEGDTVYWEIEPRKAFGLAFG